MSPALFLRLYARWAIRRHDERIREDWRAGMLAAATMNAAGGKKGGGAFGPRDFFPSLPRPKEDPEQMWRRFEAWARAHNRALEAASEAEG